MAPRFFIQIPAYHRAGKLRLQFDRGTTLRAERYTEAKMSRIASEMIRIIDKDTVDFRPNYENTRKEPTFCLPLFRICF